MPSKYFMVMGLVNKKIFLFLLFLPVLFYTVTAETSCYQETQNQSTECGGLTSYQANPSNQWSDGDWLTNFTHWHGLGSGGVAYRIAKPSNITSLYILVRYGNLGYTSGFDGGYCGQPSYFSGEDTTAPCVQDYTFQVPSECLSLNETYFNYYFLMGYANYDGLINSSADYLPNMTCLNDSGSQVYTMPSKPRNPTLAIYEVAYSWGTPSFTSGGVYINQNPEPALPSISSIISLIKGGGSAKQIFKAYNPYFADKVSLSFKSLFSSDLSSLPTHFFSFLSNFLKYMFRETGTGSLVAPPQVVTS